ncbi:TerD family protein [Parafrankia sp. EUN1f]|uniref:TerD family protein n=1 Tax=Parafrankia sp. EUN1f TaxID=102897 RepID=UPI0001C4520C|nr:TerD family protein [Parafrankia sp. EUN1f]EFC82855.1 stress protein [Parafrankia sp. EUN1f]
MAVDLSLSAGATIKVPARSVRLELDRRGGPEVDVCAVLVAGSGKVRSDADFVFFNQPVHPSGAVRVSAGLFTASLPEVEPDIETIVLVGSVDTGAFPDIAELRLNISMEPGDLVAEFVPNLAQPVTAMVFGEFYRRGGEWEFRAVGRGWDSGLAGLVTSYGVQVDDEPDLGAAGTSGGAEESDSKPSRALGLLDRALELQAPLAERHVDRLRRNRPDATPHQIVGRLNAELRAATISAGVGVGAAAAAPGVGTGVALAASGGEAVAFLNATVLYILARAEAQGIKIDDVECRRTLVMAIMLGDAGAKGIGQVAERTGQHWARQIVRGIPQAKINAINRVLGPHFVTKYGAKKGVIVLGKVVPFGIGAVIGGAANGLFSQGIIKAADRAFGNPSQSWED